MLNGGSFIVEGVLGDAFDGEGALGKIDVASNGDQNVGAFEIV